MTVTPLMGLWSGPMVILPVTPGKSLVAARAWATYRRLCRPAFSMAVAEEITVASQGAKASSCLWNLASRPRGTSGPAPRWPLAVEQGGEIHAVHRLPADLDEFRHLGAVAGEDRGLDPQVLELLGQQGVLGVVIGGVAQVRVGRLQGRNLGVKSWSQFGGSWYTITPPASNSA
jgi:hypothetical protein